MADLREMLLQEQNRLEKILQKTSEQLKDAPPGKLRLSSCILRVNRSSFTDK